MPWLTPHILRHTGASILATNGVDLIKIAELMGDSTETVRKHYAKFHPTYMEDATKKLAEIYD